MNVYFSLFFCIFAFFSRQNKNRMKRLRKLNEVVRFVEKAKRFNKSLTVCYYEKLRTNSTI